MLTQDPGKKKALKIFLDIISVLLILTCITMFLSLFGVNIPIIGNIFIGPILWLVFLILIFKFAKLTKKWGYIILFFLIIVGVILNISALNMALGKLMDSGEYFNMVGGGELGQIELPIEYYILNYAGTLLVLISLLSMLIFYFKYYRKYLSGSLSLQELGVKDARDEQQFIQQHQEKEKKQNKVGWIIVIILILIFAGVLLYMALM